MRLSGIWIFSVLTLTLLVGQVWGQSADVLFQEGLYAEDIEGDLERAMSIYQEVAANPTVTDSVGAQALYRLGMCQMKKGDSIAAANTFEQLIASYPGQSGIVGKVEPMLEDLRNCDPAKLMPADTLIYCELGSPGQNIENILKMVEGTPYENPL